MQAVIARIEVGLATEGPMTLSCEVAWLSLLLAAHWSEPTPMEMSPSSSVVEQDVHVLGSGVVVASFISSVYSRGRLSRLSGSPSMIPPTHPLLQLNLFCSDFML